MNTAYGRFHTWLMTDNLGSFVYILIFNVIFVSILESPNQTGHMLQTLVLLAIPTGVIGFKRLYLRVKTFEDQVAALKGRGTAP